MIFEHWFFHYIAHYCTYHICHQSYNTWKQRRTEKNRLDLMKILGNSSNWATFVSRYLFSKNIVFQANKNRSKRLNARVCSATIFLKDIFPGVFKHSYKHICLENNWWFSKWFLLKDEKHIWGGKKRSISHDSNYYIMFWKLKAYTVGVFLYIFSILLHLLFRLFSKQLRAVCVFLPNSFKLTTTLWSEVRMIDSDCPKVTKWGLWARWGLN